MKLQGLKIAFLIDEEFEDLEHHVPRMRLLEEGAEVIVAAKKPGVYRGKAGVEAAATHAFADLNSQDFAGVVVPGGWAPDKVRREKAALEFLKALDKNNKTLAFICHAGWVAASAGLLRAGQPVTGSIGIRDDLLAHGTVWRDEAAFRDSHFVWGRVVADIPDFCRELVNALGAKT